MTEQSTPAPLWRPTEQGARTLLLFIAVAVAAIGAIALALSFVSVDEASRPYFGAASWAIPVLMDSTIGVLTFFSIVAELNGLRAPLARYGGRVLVALTVYANVAPQRSLYGRVLHGAPPAVWTLVVVIAESTIRRLVGLSDERRIEALRRSLWLLRPVATWRIWRRMRIEQITTYREALDQDAARAAVVGRLRLHHGRMWRSKAPLAERIALRLQGRDPVGVAEILTAHQYTAQLLAGTAVEPVPEAQPEPPVEDVAEVAPKHARRAAQTRSRKGSKTPAPRRSDDQLYTEASALNAQVLTATGTGVSLRRLKAELHIGQPTAERLRARLAAAALDSVPAVVEVDQAQPQQHAEAVPVDLAAAEPVRLVEYANGSLVGTAA
ncbi:MAG TPA: DUF2637 domain-containing protein [Actinocrinis sp.]|uniref:DUF2637 domain-containing protein n=1 Tax=Actinocrinis sp. TaxID=1920516 RepID=UPI002DDD7DD5|nr:DUF2637 domain-containing protein [Actinocrinis sp.]HEV2345213.1 DUF2637 domain-containing protein [Actinocrinis sp.]